MDINRTLAQEFGLRQEQVDNTIALIDDDKTIPFIARYRKELTGSLDDQLLRELYDRLMYLRNLEKRKEEIRSAITEQEKMTSEIEAAIDAAKTLVEVEDIYRPYKPKRRTRAGIACENGLEPLSEIIMAQNSSADPEKEAEAFINEEKMFPTLKLPCRAQWILLRRTSPTTLKYAKNSAHSQTGRESLFQRLPMRIPKASTQIIMITQNRLKKSRTIVFLPLTAAKRRDFSRFRWSLMKQAHQALLYTNML